MDPAQARQVAAMGVDAIGVIGVSSSVRHVAVQARAPLFAAIATVAPGTARVLVMANPTDTEVDILERETGATVLQLHGNESPERCRALGDHLGLPIWKALRIRQPDDLKQVQEYANVVDALLLDAWVPDQLGGSGARIPIDWLSNFRPPLPWWLAGGVSAERVPQILEMVQPYGLDASSSVEVSPGHKDLAKVQHLINAVRDASTPQTKPPSP